ncbi:MAG: LacI family DNA-binding transcriptional regulator [Victivallaceae bacterium]|jgi:LacI family transcriptional regulator
MTKKTTVKDIAEKLGISAATISFVLNGQDKGISEDTRRKVIAAAVAMNYRKLPRINLLGWTRIAYLTSRIERFNSMTSFFAGVYSNMQRKSAGNKIELSLHEFSTENPETSYLQLQKLRAMDIDVFLCSNHLTAKYLLKNGLKVILVQAGIMLECVSVYCDDYSAGKIAGAYALKMGHATAGTIFPKGMPGARFSGFVEAFTTGGGQCPEEFRWTVTFDHEIMTGEIRQLSKDRKLPTMFYCFADNIMFPAIKALSMNKLRVPDDVSLIGTDNLYWGKYATPAFTTVDLNEEMFADKLIEAVMHVKAGGEPYQLAVPVKLIERETVSKLS